MKRQLIFTFLILLTVHFKAQEAGLRFSNNVTAMPISGMPKVFYSQFHPGVELSYQKTLRSFAKSRIKLEPSFGIFYHRFFQTGVRLVGCLHYDRDLGKRFTFFTGLGVGYMHSFYQYSIFKLKTDGQYVKITELRGRPQYTAQFSLGTTYKPFSEGHRNVRLSLELRTFVHGTFAKAYVPVVPYNSIQLGFTMDLQKELTSNTSSHAY